MDNIKNYTLNSAIRVPELKAIKREHCRFVVLWMRLKMRNVNQFLKIKQPYEIIKMSLWSYIAEINAPDNLEKFYVVTAHFVKEREL